jgi:hypothetical protein
MQGHNPGLSHAGQSHECLCLPVVTAPPRRSPDARARRRQVFPAVAGSEEPATLLSSGSESPGGPRRPLGVGTALQERVAALARGSGCAPGLGLPHEGHRMPAR